MGSISDMIKEKLAGALEKGKGEGTMIIAKKEDDGAQEAFDSAVSDFVDAVESKDKESASSALRAAIDIACDEHEV